MGRITVCIASHSGIDDRDLVRQELDEEQRAGDSQHESVRQHGEGRPGRREMDPFHPDGESGDEDRAVERQARRDGQAERGADRARGRGQPLYALSGVSSRERLTSACSFRGGPRVDGALGLLGALLEVAGAAPGHQRRGRVDHARCRAGGPAPRSGRCG